MEAGDVWGALWRQKLLAVCVFLVTLLAVAIGVNLAPKTYEATSVVSATAGPDASGMEDLDSLRGTLARLASSTEVVDQVQQDLDADRTDDELRRSIEAEWISGTVLIEITVDDRDPVVAAQVADLVAAALPLSDPSDQVFVYTTSNPARVPTTYSSPDLLLAGGVGLLLACVLATGAAMVRDQRRSTVDNGRAAEEAAMAPLLGHVAPPRDPTTLPALYPGTSAADVFRQLRIALEAEASGNPVSKVVVAGVTTSETNVWLGANLAISLANVSRRVLLVDGRMGERHGRTLGREPDTAGLYEVLHGTPLEDALSAGPVEHLTVLPSGKWGAEPAEEVIETDFARVMEEAEQRFDVVVALAPPLDTCDDARVMAAGGSLLLAVPEGTVSVSSLRMHSARVRSVGARLLGLVLVTRRAERLAA